MKSLRRLIYVTLVLVAASDGSSAADSADDVLQRVIENWRWSLYWFGKTGIEVPYPTGQTISALVFWNNNQMQHLMGLCSSELGECVLYSGVYLNPEPRRMKVSPGVGLRLAFMTFLGDGFRDRLERVPIQGMTVANFQLQERSLILPALQAPSAVLSRDVPAGAREEAEKVMQDFACFGTQILTRPKGCSGSLVFAHYGPEDPYWFVLRSCSGTCEFRGDSVEMLRRGDHRWEVTSAGYIDRPRAEVERLRRQIEKAEMFRLRLP